MPFLRFSRDKRGYEHTYLVQATNRRGKAVRPRILYWYRTPPGVRLGRLPFDDEVRKSLEVQNPGIVFDWPTIISTPFPPQEPEHWRERRRAERAAKQQARREEAEESTPEDSAEPADDSTLVDEPAEVATAQAGEGTAAPECGPQAPTDADGQAARKRRRRGGRRRRALGASEVGAELTTELTDAPSTAEEPPDASDSPSEDQE